MRNDDGDSSDSSGGSSGVDSVSYSSDEGEGRQKREAPWHQPEVPSSTSKLSSSPWLRQANQNQPWTIYKMQLHSKTGHNLAIYPDRKVNGTKDENDLHTHLELVSGGGPGLVRIKGLLSNRFVGMNHKGKLYSEPDPTSKNIVFIEQFQGSYTTYMSKRFERRHWYIGIKKNGKFKRGPKTKFGQRAISFLPRRKKFES